ncbi:MAG: aldehyde dehydrogenase family protein [Ramlibacter sp.]|nr:aldehyde dehydrogenase family protein [Ramlibacter sp.]
MKVQSSIFIGGQWVASTGTESIPVVNPATEETIATAPAGTAEDVDRAAKAAAASFLAWSQSSLAERTAIMDKAAGGLAGRAEEISAFIAAEIGKPITLARGEVNAVVGGLRQIGADLPTIQWEETIGNAVIVREPIGVVGAITAWNAPLLEVFVKACAAMAAGCTVVLKPSEFSPFTAFMLAEVFDEVGLPAGVLNVVSGTGPVVGEAIATHPLIDMVSITGSLRAGKRVMELAAQSLKRVALELGGKSPNIIFADADLERAVNDGVDDCLRSAGQVCAGLTRMIVPVELMDQVAQLAKARAESYVIGDPAKDSTTLGPVANASQHARVREYIRLGLSEGATAVTGGEELPDGIERGYFIRPTVFSHANNDMRIAQEEIFGPVLTIIPFHSDEEAIEIANGTVYGLGAAVWSGDPERARAVASRLRAGRVRINGGAVNRSAPHGGFKQSGVGREGGRFGIEEFLDLKAMLT